MRRPFYFACTGTGPIDPADCMIVLSPGVGSTAHKNSFYRPHLF